MRKLVGLAAFVLQVCASQTAYFVSKTIIIPHDDKKHRGGEDAAAHDHQILIVADGVGGWERHGVDPGLFSRALVAGVLERNTKSPDARLREIIYNAN